MHPHINSTSFGSIVVDDESFDHDIFITLRGIVKKRKKKLSKKIYGSSHTISQDEAEYIYEKGAEGIVIGSGQYGAAGLSDEAEKFFTRKNCRKELMPTPEAIKFWNQTNGKWIGLFHITC